MPETLYLIDAYAQIFRAYYAIRGGMRSPNTGEPTHAVFGFAAMLLKLFQQLHPHYVVLAVDMPGKTFRDEMHAEYKGTRASTPDDLITQIPRIMEMTEAFGIPIIGVPGLEADDVIGTIAHKIVVDPAYKDINIRIVSKDKDLEQLINDRVALFDIHTDTLIDAAALWENKGIRPEQVIDVLALMGDKVDNVPGVEGIGPKTAAELVHEFGSIDGILVNLDKIKGKKRENLEKGAAGLPLSRALVTLKCDADLPFTMESAKISPPDLQRLIPIFQQLGFNRFQEEVRKLAGDAPSPPGPLSQEQERGSGPAQGNLFEGSASAATATSAPTGEYRAIVTLEELEEVVTAIRMSPILSVDTETTGLGRDSKLCGICLSWEEGKGVYVPVRSPDPSAHLDEATALKSLGPVIEDASIHKCGHNLKFDTLVLLRCGIKLRGVTFDSLLASTLIDPSQPTQKLDYVAKSLLGYEMTPITALIGEGKEQASMEVVPLDKISQYAAEDADIALRLRNLLMPKLESMGLKTLLEEVEAPLSVVVAEMEHNGILCDPDELTRQGDALATRVEQLRDNIFEAAGCKFDLNSTRQLAEVLFDKLGLAAGKKTKTGRSTDIEVLEKLAATEDKNDPRTLVPGLIIEYRQLSKLISTYMGNLKAAINPQTKRIHSTFHQLVTATGRLASQNPNLQNIPVRTDVGRQIRKAFHAAPGEKLLCADYSQIELRVLAHCSGDEALIKAFEEDQDIHTAVASQVFGVSQDLVTREMRSNAKTINFGIIYGVTPFGLARRVEGLDVSGATELIKDYKRRFPGIDRFMQECVQKALSDGYVTTIMGRRRYIPEVHSPVQHLRALGERLAINSVIQGSAADLIKIAMVKVHQRIDEANLPMKLLLQIHDELVFETPSLVAQEHAVIVQHEMENAMKLRVALKAECGIGDNWLEAK